MFVGHYAAAFALKRYAAEAPLWLLFLGVQFLDLLFFPFVMLGIERIRVVPNATPSTHFEVPFMPWSHSLVAALSWALLLSIIARFVHAKPVAIGLGLAVFSHWLFDFIVHTPDLPLWSDDSIKVGLGLWNHVWVVLVLESSLVIVAVWVYVGGSRQHTTRPKAENKVWLFALTLVLANALQLFGPPPPSENVLALSAIASYLTFAGVAGWLDRNVRAGVRYRGR